MPTASVELYLVRHAHAGDPARWTGPDDRRPLSAKGRLQAQALGRRLAALQVGVDVIVSSPKLRAQQTADLIAQALGLTVRLDERLGGALTIGTLERLIDDVGDPRSVMVVGHDPDLSELAADLAGATS